MLQLFSILTALVAGYFFKKISVAPSLLNRILGLSVMVILFIMGYDFGSNSGNLHHESFELIKIISTFTIFLFLANLIAAYCVARFFLTENYRNSNTKKHASYSQYILESGKYLSYVLIGMTAGYLLQWKLVYLNSMISALLFFVLFIIGYQLRQQGISFKRILANKTGIIIALTVVVSSYIAGLISAHVLHLDTNTGLILSSGFGWYTLSGILSGQLISHHIGTASFFIDFIRELIAIILIPTLGRRYPIPLIAYSGATALDFTLPVIKINLGDEVLPIAITSGMILTLLVPVIIPLIGSW